MLVFREKGKPGVPGGKKRPDGLPEKKNARNTRGKGLPGVTEEKPLGAE